MDEMAVTAKILAGAADQLSFVRIEDMSAARCMGRGLLWSAMG
jgi:hypothetical protein